MLENNNEVMIDFLHELEEVNKGNSIMNVHIKTNFFSVHTTCNVDYVSIVDNGILITGGLDLSINSDQYNIAYDDEDNTYELSNNDTFLHVDFIELNQLN